MLLTDAQRDLRSVYLAGAPGIFVSGMVWLAAGLVALNRSPRAGMLALFLGGMLIHPLSVMLTKALGRSAAPAKQNTLVRMGLETVPSLIVGFALAYVASSVRLEWFFPAMLLVIGARYLAFQTLFGQRVYWLLGGVLLAAGWLLYKLQAPFAAGAFTGAAIEVVFAMVVFAMGRREGR